MTILCFWSKQRETSYSVLERNILESNFRSHKKDLCLLLGEYQIHRPRSIFQAAQRYTYIYWLLSWRFFRYRARLYDIFLQYRCHANSNITSEHPQYISTVFNFQYLPKVLLMFILEEVCRKRYEFKQKTNYPPIRRMAISATAKLNKKKLVDVLILFVLRVFAI